MLRPKLVLLLAEISQNVSYLRNTTSFIYPRYRKSRGTSHYTKSINQGTIQRHDFAGQMKAIFEANDNSILLMSDEAHEKRHHMKDIVFQT